MDQCLSVAQEPPGFGPTNKEGGCQGGWLGGPFMACLGVRKLPLSSQIMSSYGTAVDGWRRAALSAIFVVRPSAEA